MLDLGLDLNVWPWVWLAIAVVFAVIELTALPGSFVLLPFSISAFVASIIGFYDLSIELQWFAFAVGGAILWIVLYRYVTKFAGENQTAPGVGADRIVGLTGIVTAAIDPDDSDRRGRITVHGEIWGATSATGTPLALGTHIRIIEVSGTRAIVQSIEPDDAPPLPPTAPPTAPPPPNPPRDT